MDFNSKETVISAEVVIPTKWGEMAKVEAIFANTPEKVKVFDFFHDELSFSSNEFIGKTYSECKGMFHSKDVAYLLSL